jgi:diguanylate cyclase (GGDEF)-like protein
MNNITGRNVSSKVTRWLRRSAVVWRWLIEPSSSITGPERRHQARLLMAMLLVLISLGLLSLALTVFGVYTALTVQNPFTTIYFWVTIFAIILFVVGYGLSRGPFYPLAAVLLVGTILISTFVSMVNDPTDVGSIFFLILGGLVASLFLSARTTGFVFITTFMGLVLVLTFDPLFSISNNINALFFILMVGGLVVMAATLRQRYVEQIDRQKQQLSESEARLRELSIRDPSTGLFNRRYLEEALSLELIRAERKQYPVGIIMADIDHFKRFNDTFGHAAGDVVLVQVANSLRSHVRSSDVSCRYGGEEFVLVLPEASLKITQIRAGQIREDIRQLSMDYDGQPLSAVTLSLGVAVFPAHGSTMDSILKAADNALYGAKRGGRDRVAVAD